MSDTSGAFEALAGVSNLRNGFLKHKKIVFAVLGGVLFLLVLVIVLATVFSTSSSATVDTVTNSEQEVPLVDEPEVPLVDKPEVPLVDKPEVPLVDEPEVPLVDEPEVPLVDEPEVPVVPVVSEPLANGVYRIRNQYNQYLKTNALSQLAVESLSSTSLYQQWNIAQFTDTDGGSFYDASLNYYTLTNMGGGATTKSVTAGGPDQVLTIMDLGEIGYGDLLQVWTLNESSASASFDCVQDDQPLCAVQIESALISGYGVAVSVSNTTGTTVVLSALEADPDPTYSMQIWFLEPV